MPTVLRVDGYRFFFYSNEGNEPPHIHVESGEIIRQVLAQSCAIGQINGISLF